MMADTLVADVIVSNRGTVALFQLNTDAAKAFVDKKVELDGWQWLGNRSFAVDSRYAADLIAGMQGYGLIIG
jgi:hypothetical protein